MLWGAKHPKGSFASIKLNILCLMLRNFMSDNGLLSSGLLSEY